MRRTLPRHEETFRRFLGAVEGARTKVSEWIFSSFQSIFPGHELLDSPQKSMPRARRFHQTRGSTVALSIVRPKSTMPRPKGHSANRKAVR